MSCGKKSAHLTYRNFVLSSSVVSLTQVCYHISFENRQIKTKYTLLVVKLVSFVLHCCPELEAISLLHFSFCRKTVN